MSKLITKIVGAIYTNGQVEVEYADQTKKKYAPLNAPKGGGSMSSDWTGTTYSYYSADPKKAFEAYGIEFWGMPKSKLDDIMFQEGDLIINCSGTVWTPKPPPVPKEFTLAKPSWLDLPQVLTTPLKPHNNGELAEQVLLDWPDFKTPPKAVGFDFWHQIIKQSRDHGIKRIICCCFAGQGRTGTALASLLLATEMVDEPDIAIEYVRKNYNSKAVESKDQEEYIFDLVYHTEG